MHIFDKLPTENRFLSTNKFVKHHNNYIVWGGGSFIEEKMTMRKSIKLPNILR